MSFIKTLKTVLSISLLIFIIFLIAASFIGPGVGDFSKPIINGYEYNFAGGDGIVIDYLGDDMPHKTIVDARVDEYRVDGDKLLVARRPREIYFDQDGAAIGRLLPICEYWTIDTKKHTTLKSVDANGLHCK